MARKCYFTGKKTKFGRSIARRGKAKYLGGVGRKVTGITKRRFKPNIQMVRAVVDGKVVRIRVSAKAIRGAGPIDETQVRHIAKLSQLNLSADEIRLFSGQLANNLDYF